MVPVGHRRMSNARAITLVDRNSVRHKCIAEAFKTPYQVFVLIHDPSLLARGVPRAKEIPNGRATTQ